MGGVIKDDEKLDRDLCKPGARVFYWEPKHAWALGIIEKDDGKKFTVKGYGYNATETGPLETCTVTDAKVWPVREDVLDEDVRDLLNLTVLHDSTIQRCLYVRYMKDMVYTNIGAIVVALNPWNFKITWYTDDNMSKYLAEGDVIKENIPHSWAQAHNTYNELRRDDDNQTILISGESGAGKTEAAKIVMKYLGAISCLKGEEAQKEGARKVAFNINQASPILEGFGNAKTVRNDNSSRFGKFMKVQFNEDGFLTGAYTIKYLLEKSRIITANPNERVYHSFYLVVKGCDAGKYGLTKPVDQYHVNAGGCIDIPGVDDGEDYSLCLQAMRNCGFDEESIDGVWSAVSGMMHALQVRFQEIDKDTCKIDAATDGDVQLAAKNWCVDGAALTKEFSQKVFYTRDGLITAIYNLAQAIDARDATVKALYDELFSWEVIAINALTDRGGGKNWVGLLDIFGFEDFEYNSFEQLCINLANETLQNHYNTFIFDKDMEECRTEGVDVTEVIAPDNKPCLLMMTAKSGIFKQLDDECSIGNGTDEAFLSNVIDSHSKNPFFQVPKMAKKMFIVCHYAADVRYTVEGWLEKNRDTLKADMKLLMRSSQQPLIQKLLPEPDENAKKITVGGFFKEQLNDLMALINSTNPHWIRCVKPHPAKKPLMVDGRTMMEQLESSGVLGTVKIRKAGFPVRVSYPKFVARFKCIIGNAPKLDAPIEELQAYCRKIIEAAGIEPMKAQTGKSKMFLKNEASQRLEAVREKALETQLLNIKRCAYSVAAQLEVRQRRWLWGAQVIQEEYREYLVRSAAARAERERQKKELLEKMKAALGPFEDARESERKAIEDEEAAAWAELLKEHQDGLGAFAQQILDVVIDQESEERVLGEIEEANDWEDLLGKLNVQKSNLQFQQVEVDEEKMRREIEQEWWEGCTCPELVAKREEREAREANARAKAAASGPAAGWTGLARDVTLSFLDGSSGGGAAEGSALGNDHGLRGILREFYKDEAAVVANDVGEASESYQRKLIAKEELRRRQQMYRLFMTDYTEARLGEEEVYEYIFRENITDEEERARAQIMQSFYEQKRAVVEAGGLRGTSSEPACRKLIEKERRDCVRALHIQWKLLRVMWREEQARARAEEVNAFERRELHKRAGVDAGEIASRTALLAAHEPFRTDHEEKIAQRDKRFERRAKKLRRLHQLWMQEASRIEEERFGGNTDAQTPLQEELRAAQLAATMDRYAQAAAPVAGSPGLRHSPNPGAGHLGDGRRAINDFEEYMRRIEDGEEDVALEPQEFDSLWSHLRRVEEEDATSGLHAQARLAAPADAPSVRPGDDVELARTRAALYGAPQPPPPHYGPNPPLRTAPDGHTYPVSPTSMSHIPRENTRKLSGRFTR